MQIIYLVNVKIQQVFNNSKVSQTSQGRISNIFLRIFKAFLREYLQVFPNFPILKFSLLKDEWGSSRQTDKTDTADINHSAPLIGLHVRLTTFL